MIVLKVADVKSPLFFAGGGGSCADTTGECALKVNSGRTAPGTQPASASRQASQSDALPTDLSPHVLRRGLTTACLNSDGKESDIRLSLTM